MQRFVGGKSWRPVSLPRSGVGQKGRSRHSRSSFVLYVEGPRDHEILRRWAHRMAPELARALDGSAVILGGRQPERAAEHFRETVALDAAVRGVCVLDRDHGATGPEVDEPCDGLEFYTWPRRHIESYLLVPAAICRSLRLREDDARIDRVFREFVPDAADATAMAAVDAKRLLSSRGPIAQSVGQPVSPGRVARAMRQSELHPDILDLLGRIDVALGRAPAVAVITRWK